MTSFLDSVFSLYWNNTYLPSNLFLDGFLTRVQMIQRSSANDWQTPSSWHKKFCTIVLHPQPLSPPASKIIWSRWKTPDFSVIVCLTLVLSIIIERYFLHGVFLAMRRGGYYVAILPHCDNIVAISLEIVLRFIVDN
jgi:hypothetical protein